jgi:FtsP/CotA-like multicopper oxidase with cupredoxin domain
LEITCLGKLLSSVPLLLYCIFQVPRGQYYSAETSKPQPTLVSIVFLQCIQHPKMLFTTTLVFALQFLAVSAKLRTFNWNIGWVSASPDGLARPFVGINGHWPCPPINVNLGDIIKINAYNGLGNESTAIHFHGIFQNGTNFMDGPAMVTQCPIAPGESKSQELRHDDTQLTFQRICIRV